MQAARVKDEKIDRRARGRYELGKEGVVIVPRSVRVL